MREILFRGKSISTDKWVFGDFVSDACGISHEGYLNEYGEVGYIMTYVIPETVGQFTGLTDKNGKKIFEGDILKNEYDDIETVEYFHNRFIPFAPPFAFDSWHENEIEIIGNVHDNSELLKGGAENA